MSNFVPKKHHLRAALLFFYHQKKTAYEAHRLLVQTYGKHALGKTQCAVWFGKFKRGDFDIQNKLRGRPPKKFDDGDLQALLDEDDCQTQQQLADRLRVTRESISVRLKAMRKVHRGGTWVPCELTDRQQEKRKTICEMLLARHQRKPFLRRLVNGGEKWIYFENPKRKKSSSEPTDPAALAAGPSRYAQKTRLCVWWDRDGVICYELLGPGETVTPERYQLQLIALEQALREKRSEGGDRQDGRTIILLHDPVPSHSGKPVEETIAQFRWEALPHVANSPDLFPSSYHLFPVLGFALSNQRFGSLEHIEQWLDRWFSTKDGSFFWRGLQQLPERWEKCIQSDGNYFEK